MIERASNASQYGGKKDHYRVIAEIDKSLKELNSIHVSCQDIRKDLVRIAQALDEKFDISN
jgi:hypothetical protein